MLLNCITKFVHSKILDGLPRKYYFQPPPTTIDGRRRMYSAEPHQNHTFTTGMTSTDGALVKQEQQSQKMQQAVRPGITSPGISDIAATTTDDSETVSPPPHSSTLHDEITQAPKPRGRPPGSTNSVSKPFILVSGTGQVTGSVVGSGPGVGPRRAKACEYCRSLKVRCIPRDESRPTDPCVRCVKAKRDCIFHLGPRRRNRRTDK